jgi:hypothetical protein
MRALGGHRPVNEGPCGPRRWWGRNRGTDSRRRLWGRRDESGQALALVSGVMLMLTLGSVILVQDVGEQNPLVESDLIQHQAYRALQAGLDEYLYKANVNADYIICDSANQTTGFCPGLAFGQWIPVQGTGTGNGPPSWFYFANPQLNYTTGIVSMTVEGAAGYPSGYAYQTATVTLEPLNDFLLDVLWINYNQTDPAVLNPNNPPTCGYDWQVGIEAGCQEVNFITGDSLTGNLFVNDSIFTCGSPSFETVRTADPNADFVNENGSCGGSGSPTATSKTDDLPVEAIPTDDTQLASVAAQGGCLYEGPTTIVLTGTTMDITSPDTPTGRPTGAPGSSPSNDSLNQAGNTSVCMPSSSGGSVALPNNEVVFVENCLSGDASCTAGGAYNPMSGDGETGASGPTYGDAIVSGTLTGPLTIGAQNNDIIDGNLCYSSAASCASLPAASATDVLGLIAYNYVEINHPLSGGNNAKICGTGGAPAAPGCDETNWTVNAVILALNHSFLVNNYSSGAALGTITLNGTVSQNWRGPVGQSSGGSPIHGYTKNYVYDSRLRYFSPPYYLSPGTASWGIASINVSGTCTVSCSAP